MLANEFSVTYLFFFERIAVARRAGVFDNSNDGGDSQVRRAFASADNQLRNSRQLVSCASVCVFVNAMSGLYSLHINTDRHKMVDSRHKMANSTDSLCDCIHMTTFRHLVTISKFMRRRYLLPSIC